MRNLRTLFAWSLIGHFLIIGFMLIGSALPRRPAPSRAVYQVQMVEPVGSPAPSPAAPEQEAPAVSDEPSPEPEPEVKISPAEQRRREEEERKRREDARRREEERQRRAQEQTRTRRELEEARKRREAEERERSERRQEELSELRRLRSELSEYKDIGGLRTEESGGPALPPGYADSVHNRIFSAWEPVAVRSSAELSFFISPDGSVSAVNVERSSGSGPYDESCRRAVMEAGRMPALPAGFGREGVRVYVTFKN